jgi:hypothetical protein
LVVAVQPLQTLLLVLGQILYSPQLHLLAGVEVVAPEERLEQTVVQAVEAQMVIVLVERVILHQHLHLKEIMVALAHPQ